MKIDKEKLKALTMLSDEELWSTICAIGEAKGFNIPKKAPPKGEMEKIRSALCDAEKINLTGALRVIDKYRKGK